MEKKEKKKNNQDQMRCDCGKLYLVKTDDGYEFKCSRCKKIHLLKYEDIILEYLTKGDDSFNLDFALG